MKMPKYIDKLINTRANLASQLNYADYRLSEWLEKNNVKVEEYDVFGGCEMYANPWDSAARVRQAIKDNQK